MARESALVGADDAQLARRRADQPRRLAQLASARWVAITVKRSREEPSGTVGGRIPWAKTPRSSSRSQSSIVRSASPTSTGTIWVCRAAGGEALGGERRRAASPRWRCSRSTRCGSASSSSSAASAAATRRRRRRGGEDEGAGRVDQVVAQLGARRRRRRRRSRAPCRACRRPRRPRRSGRRRRPSRGRPGRARRSRAPRRPSAGSRGRGPARASSASGATSPSIEKTPSVTISEPRPPASRSPQARCSTSPWR